MLNIFIRGVKRRAERWQFGGTHQGVGGQKNHRNESLEREVLFSRDQSTVHGTAVREQLGK